MNEVQILRKLASAARREPVPNVCVCNRVLNALDDSGDELDRYLAWIAGFSAAAAVPAGILAVYILEVVTDPVGQLFSVFGGMML
jgi:hypothetical protein